MSINPIRKVHEINKKHEFETIEIGSLELFGGYKYGNLYQAYTIIDITGGMGVATVMKLLEMEYKPYGLMGSNNVEEGLISIIIYHGTYPGEGVINMR